MPKKEDIYRKESPPRFSRRSSRRRTAAADEGGTWPGRKRSSADYDESLPPHLVTLTQRRRRRGKKSSANTNRFQLLIIGILVLVIVGYFALLTWNIKYRKDISTQDPSPPVLPPDIKPPPEPEPTPTATELNTFIAEVGETFRIMNRVEATTSEADYSEGVARLEERRARHPELIKLKIQLAKLYMEGDEFGKARPLLQQAINADPRDAVTKLLLMRTVLKLEDYPAALTVGKWILSEDKTALEVDAMMADAYLKQNRVNLAIDHLQKIVDYESRNVVALNNLGMAYMRIQQFDRALKIFQSVIHHDPLNSVAHYNLAVCYAQSFKPKSAVEVLEKAVKQFGSGFVKTWLTAEDFNPIRNSPEFIRLQEKTFSRIPGAKSEPGKAPPILPFKKIIEAP